MTTPVRPADELTLACEVRGCGPRLVLLHGGMGSWTHWTRNLDALARHFEVHAFDLPGCGDSPAVPTDIPDEEYVAIVARAITRLAAHGTVRLAGFSFGSVISAMLAARIPDAIARVSLLGPGGFGPVTGRRLDLRRMPEGAVDAATETAVLRHNLLAMMLVHPQSVDDEALRVQRANVRRTRFDSRRFSLSAHVPDSLARVRCPVQVIYGTRDNLAWPSVAARVDIIRQAAPHVRVDLVPDAGHWVQFEAADEVNRALLAFHAPSAA